eukprot:42277_1
MAVPPNTYCMRCNRGVLAAGRCKTCTDFLCDFCNEEDEDVYWCKDCKQYNDQNNNTNAHKKQKNSSQQQTHRNRRKKEKKILTHKQIKITENKQLKEEEKKQTEKAVTHQMSKVDIKENDEKDNISFIASGVDLAAQLSKFQAINKSVLLNIILKSAFQYTQDLIASGSQALMESDVFSELLASSPKTPTIPTATALSFERLLMFTAPLCFQFVPEKANPVELFGVLLENSKCFQIEPNKTEKELYCDIFSHCLAGSKTVSNEGRLKIMGSLGERWRRLGDKIRKPVIKRYKEINVRQKRNGEPNFDYIVAAQTTLYQLAQKIKPMGKTDLDKMECEIRRRRFIKTTYLQLFEHMNE